MNKRYKAVEGSKTGHCCFDATVIDTLVPEHGDDILCECFEMEHAQKIADALNAVYQEQGGVNHERVPMERFW